MVDSGTLRVRGYRDRGRPALGGEALRATLLCPTFQVRSRVTLQLWLRCWGPPSARTSSSGKRPRRWRTCISTPRKQIPLKRSPEQAPEQLGRIRFDTYAGMALFQYRGLLHYSHRGRNASCPRMITNIGTADQAAKALEPLAGHFAFLFFSR